VKRHIFLSADGRVRPVWRFCLSVFMVAAAYVGVGIGLGFFFSTTERRPGLLVALFLVNLLMLGALLGIYKLLSALLDSKPLGAVGLAFRGRWQAELGWGLALGTAMMLAVAGLERACGVADFSWSGDPARRILEGGVSAFLVLAVAGTAEELTFRGYPFQRLADALGPVGAVVVFSALFGIAHLGNRSHTWISTCNTALVGATFAVAYLRTRALWLPVGMHVAWNFVQGFVLGLPISGIPLSVGLVRPDIHGARWLTGGDYGPEGSLLATVVILLATVYLLFSKRIYISKEMRELVLGPAAPVNPAEVEAAPPSPESGETSLPHAN
jgi:CAAX protease family protein